MRLRRSGLVMFAVAAAGLLGTACHPPNKLQAFSISRTGHVSVDGHSVSLRGTVACDYPGRVDLVMTTAQGFSPEIAPAITCDGPKVQRWAQTFYDADTVQPKGGTIVTIQAWTGMGDHSPYSTTVSSEVSLS